MRLSLEWLSSHVDLSGLSPDEVGELFTMRVAEVEEVGVPGGGWPGVVVGRVLSVRAHPDADKLRLVSVDYGAEKPNEVVCGAPNVASGQLVCYAHEGTELPGGLVLKKRKIRGFVSNGMVLSERELGLSDEHEGILVLETAAAPGTPAREVLGGGAVMEVENTAITTRPDLWGHYGCARELAAVLDRELEPLDLGDPLPAEEPAVRVDVEAPELCPRYLGWVIRGIEIGPSPDWMRRRLEEAGQRPINNVVDLTNYILLECGQPIHAFDRRQIAGGRIVVRAARAGEPVTTLDGVERELPAGTCVIADPERAVAIAGVMGLANSEVLEDTTEIILEVANFEMTSIRRTAQALHLRTESAIRFEKGLDAEGVPVAARRFFRLLSGICPGAEPVGGPCDVRVDPEPRRVIGMESGFLAARLGTPVPETELDGILGRLGFGVSRGSGRLEVTVPSWRAGRDVSIPEDLVEEVGRVRGWDRIEPTPFAGELEPVPEEPQRAARRTVRRVLALRMGFVETHLYPFTTADEARRAGLEPGTLQLANAEQPGLDLLATSHVPRLLRLAQENLRYRDDVALFVSAPVFPGEGGEGGLPLQVERVGFVLARRGDESPVLEAKGAVEALAEAFDLTGARLQQREGPAWLHPGRAALFGRGRDAYGWLGEVHPAIGRAFGIEGARVALADLDLDAMRAADTRPRRMRPISRFPTVPFDVAVVVDRRTPASEVEAALRKADRKLVREVSLFDVYEGSRLPAGKRSLAFTIVFGSHEATLGTQEIEGLRAAVEREVVRRGWTLRV